MLDQRAGRARSSTTSSARRPCPRSSARTAGPRCGPGSATRSSRQVMAETGAVFGGEHSGHYYFRDNYRADSGLIAALVVLEQLSAPAQPLSELRKPFERYAASGEINTEVADPQAVIERVADALRRAPPGPPRRPHRRPRRLVVQPAAVQHRAAAAPQPRSARRRRVRPARRRRCSPSSEEATMALDPQLLEILACPEDKGPLLLLRGRGRALQPPAEAALRDPRRHPGDADRRGRDGRRRRARAPAGQGRGGRHQADVHDE